MNKAELIEAIAGGSKLTKADSGRALDANKKIIAKRIGVDQLEDFITKHDEFEMKKKIK